MRWLLDVQAKWRKRLRELESSRDEHYGSSWSPSMQIKILRFLLPFYHDRFSRTEEFEPLPNLPDRELYPSNFEWQGVPHKGSAKIRHVLISVHRNEATQGFKSAPELSKAKIPLDVYRLRDAARHCVFYLQHRNIKASIAKRGKTWSVYVPRVDYERAKEIHARFVPAPSAAYATSRRADWTILILGWAWLPLFLLHFVLLARSEPTLVAYTTTLGITYGAVVTIAAWSLARMTFNLMRK
jgi:hypothetical protein